MSGAQRGGGGHKTRRDRVGEEREWKGQGRMISRERIVLGGMPSGEVGCGALVSFLCVPTVETEAAAAAPFSWSPAPSLSPPVSPGSG